MLAPTILVVLLLGTLRSLEAFEIEFILGPPARIDVYSTAIYRHVFASPPDYGPAFALGIIVFMIMVPFVLAQQMVAGRRSRTSIGGKFAVRLVDLGRWRWLVFAAFLSLLAAMTALPVFFMVLGSFMEVFGYFDVPGRRLHRRALADGAARSCLPGLAVGHPVDRGRYRHRLDGALPGVAYLIVRTRYRGRGLLDFLTWIPTTVPGIIIGLALLWMFLRTPFLRPVYGTEIGPRSRFPHRRNGARHPAHQGRDHANFA